jgi:protein TonB
VLIAGLSVHFPARLADEGLKVFGILPPPPPPRETPPPDRIRSKATEGAAAPPNLRSHATEIVAPVPILPMPVPPPIVVAPIANTGAQASQGAAVVAGPGTGAGGAGNGAGSGRSGNGDGDGGTPPRLIHGRLKDSDYPKAAGEAGIGGTVAVEYEVETNGRVGDCEVTGSSGNAALDATTCRLIQQRFRFKPSRDENGHVVPAMIVENHTWVIHNDPPSPEGRP